MPGLATLPLNPNRKIFEARKRETAALGAGEKLVLGHPLAATIGDSARCMQNLEKVLFTGPKTSDTVTFILRLGLIESLAGNAIALRFYPRAIAISRLSPTKPKRQRLAEGGDAS